MQTLVFTLAGNGISGESIDLMVTSQDADGNDIAAGLPDAMYMSSAPDIAEVRAATGGGSGYELVLLRNGTATITASRGEGVVGDVTYGAATDVTQDITVGEATQTIMFTPPANAGQVGEEINLAASANSGLEVTLGITAEERPAGTPVVAGTVATLDAGTGALTLVGVGEVVVTATQAGGVGSDGVTYVAAIPVTQTITVSKQAQTIMFTLAMTTGMVDDKIDLTATADSNLPVSYASSNETVAAIGTDTDAGKLVLKTAGTATITASQSGDDTYAAATDVTQTIMVEAAMVLGIEEVADGFVLYPNPTSGKLHFSERVEQFRLYGIEGRLLETRKNVRSADLSARPAGLYFVEVIRDGRSVRWRVVRE